MSDRGSRQRRRTAAGEETRGRILAAARDLAVAEGFSGFTVEKVAERAGVSRMTVYYQFGSKTDLLEALFDELAARGRMDRLAEAFRAADPVAGLATFIEVFCGFWDSDREGIRRLRSWSAMEPGRGGAGHGRDRWQREGIRRLVERIWSNRERTVAEGSGEVDDVVDLLHVMLGFESYDRLAGTGRSREEIQALLTRGALAVLGETQGNG